MANFDTEREGQIEFYKTFLPLIDPNLTLDDILADDNDGVYYNTEIVPTLFEYEFLK